MSHPKFQYSLLKYVHSDLLGEVLNIGILFIFQESGEVVFKYPSNFTRVRAAYGRSFSQVVVNGVLRGIEKSVNLAWEQFQRPLDLVFEQDGQSVILNQLLLQDATVLRFGDIQTVVQYGTSGQIVSDYYNLYFSHYEETELTRQKYDEEYISKAIKALLAKRTPDYDRLIQKDVVLKATMLPEGNFAFDFAWKNEINHYVKPVGFDFQDSKAINQKAAAYFGYLTAISESIGHDAVDILTIRPQIRSLWPAYDKAVEMIDAVRINKKIIENGSFDSYADEIVHHSRHSS